MLTYFFVACGLIINSIGCFVGGFFWGRHYQLKQQTKNGDDSIESYAEGYVPPHIKNARYL
jgi:hypothetical protein